MRKGLTNPNSIQALNEMKTEIANELGIKEMESIASNKNDETNREINRKIVERFRRNLIGFK